MRTVPAILTTAALLAGSACSSDEDAPTPAPSAGAVTSSPTPSSLPFDRAAAEIAAKAGLLTLADFPSGWTAAPTEDDDDGDEFAEAMQDCLGTDSAFFTDDPADSVSQDSLEFSSPDEALTISNSVIVAREDRLTEFFDVLAVDKLPVCLARVIDEVVAPQVLAEQDPGGTQITFSPARVTRISFPTLGDQTVPLRAKLTAAAEGLAFDVFLDLVFIRTGNAATSVTFEAAGLAMPSDIAERYARLAAERIGVTSAQLA